MGKHTDPLALYYHGSVHLCVYVSYYDNTPLIIVIAMHQGKDLCVSLVNETASNELRHHLFMGMDGCGEAGSALLRLFLLCFSPVVLSFFSAGFLWVVLMSFSHHFSVIHVIILSFFPHPSVLSNLYLAPHFTL